MYSFFFMFIYVLLLLFLSFFQIILHLYQSSCVTIRLISDSNQGIAHKFASALTHTSKTHSIR